MIEQFVPYKESKLLEEINFKEICFGKWASDKIYKSECGLQNYPKEIYPDYVNAPLWQQAFDWFENQHGIFGAIKKFAIGSDEWIYTYNIEYVPKEFEDAKRRVGHTIYIDSFGGGGASYSGGWDKLIEAKLVLLNKLIDIYKKDRL